MTAKHPTETSGTGRIDGLGALRLLEALSRIHRWILLIDSRRNVLWTSEHLSELTGGERLAQGVDARKFLNHLLRPQQILPLRSSLRGRSHLTGVAVDLESRDGSTRTIDLDLTRIPSEAGELLLVIASERSERSANALDAQLLEALPDALLVVDAEGMVRRVNGAALRLLGASEDQALARPVATLIAGGADDLERFAVALLATGKTTRCELGLDDSSGASRRLDVSITPLSGGLRCVVLRDVTSDRQAEQQLRWAGEEIEHCVAALAHDLRSPLVGLLGFSRLLRDDYAQSLDETGRHFVDRIEQAARTMESLIHDLLELARIGAPGEQPCLVDPREVLQQISAEFKPRLEANRINLELYDEIPSRVYCDRSRLYQVFSNLIGNAIQHMGPKRDACIRVRILESEDEHEIVVSDNGRGVDPVQRERIFEIFQSIPARSGGVRGTGMGLAIVKKIAEKQGGRAWVDGERGEGAHFHVTLPRG